MVEAFGVGILTLPAEQVMTWRRIMIAEHEQSTHSRGTPSKEDALARLVKQKKRRSR